MKGLNRVHQSINPSIHQSIKISLLSDLGLIGRLTEALAEDWSRSLQAVFLKDSSVAELP